MIVFRLYACQVEQQVWQRISHHPALPRLDDFAEDVRVCHHILVGAPYPERYVELLMCQPCGDFCTMVSAEVFVAVVETLFTVVGKVDDHRLFVVESLHNLVYDGVVVEGGIVVVCQYVALMPRQVGTLIVVTSPLPAVFGIALPIVHVLSHEVEDEQLSLSFFFTSLS